MLFKKFRESRKYSLVKYGFEKIPKLSTNKVAYENLFDLLQFHFRNFTVWFSFSNYIILNVTRIYYCIETEVNDTVNELYVPRRRIKSFQSTDSLDKWRVNDVINEVDEIDLTGKYS